MRRAVGDGTTAEGTLLCMYCHKEHVVDALVYRMAKALGKRNAITCPPPSDCWRRHQERLDLEVEQKEREVASLLAKIRKGLEPPIPDWMRRDGTVSERIRGARTNEGGSNPLV